jgi:hypothetical protein
LETGPSRRAGRAGSPAALLANAVVICLVAALGWLHARDPDLYYRSVQEDEVLEWATFWGFLSAAAVYGVAAFRQRRNRAGLPWFLAGVGLFCFAVGMEEISWGQRLLGFRPPVYFLEHNFQQELNVHNVFGTTLRKLILEGAVLGYGVALPLAARVTRLGPGIVRLGVIAPPVALVPAFLASLGFYEWYPLEFSGEIVECMLGLEFLFAALAAVAAFPRPGASRSGLRVAPVVGAVLLVVALGVANAAVSRRQRSAEPGNLMAARAEVEALRRDFVAAGTESRGGVPTTCGTHKRLYAYVHEDGALWLMSGEFVGLVDQGLPEERAGYLLDPWNLPYWIRDRCDSEQGRRVVFVYSFGPNRRRDSTPWEILGDDVGARIEPPPGD